MTTEQKRSRRPKTQQDISAAQDPDALLTLATVCQLTGFGRTTIRDLVRDGRFPAPIHLGSRSTLWVARDVREWLRRAAAQARAAGQITQPA